MSKLIEAVEEMEVYDEFHEIEWIDRNEVIRLIRQHEAQAVDESALVNIVAGYLCDIDRVHDADIGHVFCQRARQLLSKIRPYLRTPQQQPTKGPSQLTTHKNER